MQGMWLGSGGIHELIIQVAARSPDWVEPDPKGHERRFAQVSALGGRTLRIVCDETDTEIRVITVFLDRGARRPE
jgi:hypothetical protein